MLPLVTCTCLRHDCLRCRHSGMANGAPGAPHAFPYAVPRHSSVPFQPPAPMMSGLSPDDVPHAAPVKPTRSTGTGTASPIAHVDQRTTLHQSSSTQTTTPLTSPLERDSGYPGSEPCRSHLQSGHPPAHSSTPTRLAAVHDSSRSTTPMGHLASSSETSMHSHSKRFLLPCQSCVFLSEVLHTCNLAVRCVCLQRMPDLFS